MAAPSTQAPTPAWGPAPPEERWHRDAGGQFGHLRERNNETLRERRQRKRDDRDEKAALRTGPTVSAEIARWTLVGGISAGLGTLGATIAGPIGVTAGYLAAAPLQGLVSYGINKLHERRIRRWEERQQRVLGKGERTDVRHDKALTRLNDRIANLEGQLGRQQAGSGAATDDPTAARADAEARLAQQRMAHAHAGAPEVTHEPRPAQTTQPVQKPQMHPDSAEQSGQRPQPPLQPHWQPQAAQQQWPTGQQPRAPQPAQPRRRAAPEVHHEPGRHRAAGRAKHGPWRSGPGKHALRGKSRDDGRDGPGGRDGPHPSR